MRIFEVSENCWPVRLTLLCTVGWAKQGLWGCSKPCRKDSLLRLCCPRPQRYCLAKPLVQCNLVLVTLNLVTTWDLVTIALCLVLLQVPKCFELVQIVCARPKIYLHVVAVTKFLCQTKRWFAFSNIVFCASTNEFNFTTMIPQVELFSFFFLEEINNPKKPFWNQLTIKTTRHNLIFKDHLFNLLSAWFSDSFCGDQKCH